MDVSRESEALLARVPRLSLPPSTVLSRSGVGGAPAKTARDVAVLMARLWRVAEGDSVGEADAWILAHWKSRGLSEAAHVRTRIRAALKLPELQDFGLIVEGLVGLVSTQRGEVLEGSRGWIWAPAMHAAISCSVQPRLINRAALNSSPARN